MECGESRLGPISVCVLRVCIVCLCVHVCMCVCLFVCLCTSVTCVISVASALSAGVGGVWRIEAESYECVCVACVYCVFVCTCMYVCLFVCLFVCVRVVRVCDISCVCYLCSLGGVWRSDAGSCEFVCCVCVYCVFLLWK